MIITMLVWVYIFICRAMTKSSKKDLHFLMKHALNYIIFNLFYIHEFQGETNTPAIRY